MSRIIKFRAWDTDRKAMTVPFTLKNLLKREYISQLDDRIVMQFTGLTDKNGKEIYEGDVVQRDEVRWNVYFGENTFQPDSYGWCVKPVDDDRTGNLDSSVIQGEIIGNIYENPELLTV